MIIGNGLLAKTFASYADAAQFVIFASGVSNSQEISSAAFDREKTLLVNTMKQYPDKTFVYFSTCSIYDPDMASNSYVQHKLHMEKLVSDAMPSHYIFRFPQVVGKTTSPTIVNYFYQKIKEGASFDLWVSSRRNLIDCEDVFNIVDYILSHHLYINSTINVASPNDISPLDIVNILEAILGKKGCFQLVQKGSFYEIDTAQVQHIYSKLGICFDDNYSERIIRKYFAP